MTLVPGNLMSISGHRVYMQWSQRDAGICVYIYLLRRKIFLKESSFNLFLSGEINRNNKIEYQNTEMYISELQVLS